VYLCKDEPIKVHHFYRAMDFLLDFQDKFQKDVFWTTSNLFNLKVDLIFFDTTNTYFETEDIEDTELKAYGKSKEKRNDLPLVTIGLAVTREGIPVRCWVLPGNQSDAKVVDQVQKDLNSWKLGRVVWVMDRGMTSDQNRIILQKAGGHYILGEKLRGNKLSEKALNKGGIFKIVEDNLHIKEVIVGEEGTGSRRYVVVYNPQQAVRDQKSRDSLLKRLEFEIEKVNKMSESKKVKAKGRLFNHISMSRYVKELKNSQLRINKAKVKQEQALDGKYLLSTSDDSLSAEDVAYGYKQLLEVERAFRTLKSTLDLRPVHHSKDERIKTHVLLCWMALLLVRLIEKETGMTWENIRNEMQRLCLGKFSNKNGHILQHTELTKNQCNILKKLKIKSPKKVLAVDITT